ncbi:uncharacterized protein [Chironomus tepperi]|uniref:uncharacterized protein n=1 Tax=Chironomus tepperi TaxID=113505 RepID=UPI00391F462E
MKNYFVLIFVISSLIITIDCSSISHRTKRSPDGFMDKLKTGLIDLGVGTKNVFVKGYEETKNLFSSDRKVGDYVLNDINVRSNFNSIRDSQESEGQKIESSTIRTKREVKGEKEDEEKIDELPDDHESEEQSKSEAAQDKEKDRDLDLNEALMGAPPPAGFIFLVPLSCKENQILVRGHCRPIA